MKRYYQIRPAEMDELTYTVGHSSGAPAGILTAFEVAKELRCSKAHIYNAINGKVPGVTPLPAIALGRRKLIRRESLSQWIRENERAAGAMI